MIAESRRLTVEKAHSPADDVCVRLKHDGEFWGDVLPGAVLERQFVLDDEETLLFLTDDVPYEDTLRIFLLAPDGSVLDGLTLGAAYATGTLDNLSIEGQATISFEFVHRGRCRLTIEKDPKIRWNLLFKPGVQPSPSHRLRGRLHLEFLSTSR